MSIKNLFGKSFKSYASGTADLESTTYAINQVIERSTYLPPIDFSDPANFAKYGLAEVYYADAISRIYNYYPYDGSKAEIVEYHQESTYLDRYIYEQKYPKTTGYINLGTTANYTANADGYGRTSTAEYIRTWGGLHTGSDPLTSKPLSDSFDQPAKYKLDLNRTQNWRVNPASGSTIEFWLKIKDFDTVNKTKSQVVLDLWNGVPHGSGTGRLTLEVYKANAVTDSVLRLTMKDQAPAGPEQENISDSITDSFLAEWHHYALTIKNGTSGIDTILYIDGEESKKVTNLGGGGATLSEFPGRVTGFIGAMQTSLPSGDGATNAAKLSGSLDEFRFWKTARTGRQVGLNWFRQIGGGANTDDETANNDLGVYYRFNEGIVGLDVVDKVVVDYSGRIANGEWIGYSTGTNQRVTGSAFNLSSHNLVEELNPILYPTHSRVVALESEMQLSGATHDSRYGNSLYYSFPAFLIDEDINGGLKKLTQVFGAYFDTLHAQITELPKIKDKRYAKSTERAIPFAAELLKNKGFIVKDIFTNTEIVELISNADINAVKFSENLEEIKNLIYTNIYNNLETIYKSKGTEKSIRNLIRCFGVDDELIKLNVYTDGGIHYFNDKAKATSVKKKYVKTEAADFLGTVYQTSSATNTLSFISGSQNSAKTSAENSALTIEADVFVPYKKSPSEQNYSPTPMLSASVFGFHQANALNYEDYTWQPQTSGERELANLQVYLVRDELDSKNAKFVVKNTDKSINLESDWINDIYDNNRWNLALRVKPVTYPFAGNVTTTAASPVNYLVELYGVTHNFDEIEHEFTLSSTINNVSGSGYLNFAKRVYAGAEYTNFTGSIANRSDVQIGAVRGWLDYVDNDTIKAHNKDPLNYGNPKAFRGSNLFTVDNKHIYSEDLTIFSWDFDTVTGTDSSGDFTVDDISSGSSDVVYASWIDSIIRREYQGRGRYFPPSTIGVIENEYLYAQRKELPEISYTNDNVFIKGDKDINFIVDDDVSDNFYALELSMNQIVSEEMLKMFASIQEYSNLISRPVDHYRLDYKRLAKVREDFFSRVESDLDQEAFINYYKWIDQSISEMVSQLIPASVNYADSVSDTIESHILERNKYQRNPGLIYNIDVTPEASARGIEELTYNWKFGHSPNWYLRKATGSVSLNSVGIANFYDTVLRITDASGTLKRYILRNTAPSNTGTTVSLDPGSGAVDHVIVGVAGLTFATAVAQLVSAVNSANGHNGTIIAEQGPVGVLNLTQAAPGTSGNIDIIAQSTVTDGSSTWATFGIGDRRGFSGGVDSPENTNCLWHLERKERDDITDRESIRQVLVNETNASSSTLATSKKAMYQGSTYARRRLSKPYKFGVDFGNVLHGGTNYRKQKDRNFFRMATSVLGKKGSSGEPLNVFAIGLGTGNDIVGPKDCKDKGSPTQKHYYDAIITAGKFSQGSTSHTLGSWNGFEYRVDAGKYWPANFVSASVKSGYNKKIDLHFKSGSVVANLHSDTVYIGNDIPMQGPFTNTHVGGNQHRHVEINRYDKNLRNPGTTGTPNQLQSQYTRPEAWRLLVGDNPSSVTPDGAIGFTGPDYGGPYPDFTRKWAIYSREEKAKRPVNIRNIKSQKKGWLSLKTGNKYATGSYSLGNFERDYEVVHTFGYKEQRLNMRDFADDQSIFEGIYKTKSLSQTTQPSSLFAAGTLLNIEGRIKLSYDAGISALATNAAYNGFEFIFKNPWGFGLHKNHVITVNQGSSTTNKDQIGLNSITTDADVRTKIRAAIDAAITAEVILGTRSAVGTVDLLSFNYAGEGAVYTSTSLNSLEIADDYRGSGNRIGEAARLSNDHQNKSDTESQKTVIKTRFAAPGSIDTMSPYFLDVFSQEYSVYNSINYRNLTVRGSGSGELGTIRVSSNLLRRNGLRTLLARHCGKGGLDSEYDKLSYEDSGSKDPQPAFFKQHRNTLRTPRIKKSERRMAIHVPYHATAGDCALKNISFKYWPTNHPPLSFSFWFKGDDPIQDASNDRTIMYLGGAGEITANIQFKANTKQLQVALGGGSEMTEWLYDAAPLYDSWAFYTIVWGGDEDTAPKIYYNNIEISLSNTTYFSGGFKSIKYSNLDPATSLAFFDNSTGAIGELEGSLANFAIWRTALSPSRREELYELDGNPLGTDMASLLVDFYKLGTEPQFFNLTDGLKISAGKTIPSSIGRNTLTTNFGLSGSLGPFDIIKEIEDVTVHDNKYVSSLLPRSDFQYAWINGTLSCSVGDWLLDQRIRGYAPPSGELTIVGESSILRKVSAIQFPTISDITCCKKGTEPVLKITIPAQPDGVPAQSFTTDKSIELVDDSVGAADTNKILESYLDQMTIDVSYESSCCDEDTLKYKIVWWQSTSTEPEGSFQNDPIWPVGNVDILATNSSDDIVYIRVTIKDCDSQTDTILITLTKAKTQ